MKDKSSVSKRFQDSMDELGITGYQMERDGKSIILDRRKKTDEDYYIVLLSPALAILKKYGYKLPLISNVRYNYYLKVVAQFAKIDKPLTTHMARHTFAVFALNHGIKIEVLAKMMGHTDIKTTQIYAKILDSSVEAGFDVLEKSLNKSGRKIRKKINKIPPKPNL